MRVPSYWNGALSWGEKTSWIVYLSYYIMSKVLDIAAFAYVFQTGGHGLGTAPYNATPWAAVL